MKGLSPGTVSIPFQKCPSIVKDMLKLMLPSVFATPVEVKLPFRGATGRDGWGALAARRIMSTVGPLWGLADAVIVLTTRLLPHSQPCRARLQHLHPHSRSPPECIPHF
jgi:hypothetical protein